MAEQRVFDAWAGPALSTAAEPPPAVLELDGWPPGAAPLRLRHPRLDGSGVRRLATELRDARRRVLLPRRAVDVAATLGAVGARFLDEGDPLRRRALDLMPPTAGMSPAMAREVLDRMAADWTAQRLVATLERELGDASALDGFVDDPPDRRVRALGPPLQLHVTAGTVPGVSVTSLLRGLLVKSAVLLKPGRGDVVLPVLFVGGLLDADPELAAAAVVAYWPGGASTAAEDAALDEADLVVAYGGDDTVASARSRMRPTTPLVAYHHRVSLGVVGREALVDGGTGVARTAAAAARAVALFDQRGCVSPHLLYVEEGGATPPDAFARALADALDALHGELPPGRVEPEEAAALQQLRGTAELRRAAGEPVEVMGGGAAGWTVVLDPDRDFRSSCLNRFVRVVQLPDAAEVPERLAPLGRWLQSVALVGMGPRREALAGALAEVGVLRVTTFEGQAFPPPWWHHDGRGGLEPLLRWTDLE